MRTLLQNIFAANKFDRIREWERVDFYSNNNRERKEFYLVEVISKVDFLAWEINENSSLTGFDELALENREIQKNTSLILAVKVDNFQADLIQIKNKVLQVEEDAYYFKKYVVVYTDNSIQTLSQSENTVISLKQILLHQPSFVAFKENMSASEEYFVTMQLFLKLPFLPTPVDTNVELTSIEALLENRLTSEEKVLLAKLIEVGNLDNLGWQDIRSQILLPNASEEEIRHFISKF